MSDAFRSAVREWLDQNCPAEVRGPVRDDGDVVVGGSKWAPKHPAQRVWLDRMAAQGWTVPDWPTEYGGAGLSRSETKVLREEMARIGARAPLMASMGISMLGPALLKFGTDAQKAEHLPKIANGAIRWAQGYSEPNAGSDLAAIATRCADHGDHFRVTGQKVWTSGADQADWIFALVRTNTDAPKHKGISFVLLDMAQPGVEARPIRLISGRSPFCETFFDEARAEKHNLVGTRDEGWTIAKYLLTHEREMIGEVFGASEPSGLTPAEIALEKIGRDADGKLADTFLRADIARLDIDGMAFQAAAQRITDQAKAGQSIGAESSTLKYYGTEYNKRRYEVLMSVEGTSALAWDADDDLARNWLRTKANSIEGGTSEIQLNIIAKHILGLPSA